MRRLLATLGMVALAAAAAAQSGFVTVSGSNLQDSTGTKIKYDTIIFTPVNAQGSPISYQVNGNGQATTSPVSAYVSNGAFTVTLPDTSLTSPRNVCFSARLRSGALGSGYACIQPAASNSWCAASLCNFDHYVPSTPGLALALVGSSSIGSSDVTGQTASQASVNLVGTVSSAGKYRISYYASQHALCGSGSNSVVFTFHWTDDATARSANSISLTMGTMQSSAAGSIQGAIPIYASASTAITYTSTVIGSCASGGPSSYDAHISVEAIQ